MVCRFIFMVSNDAKFTNLKNFSQNERMQGILESLTLENDVHNLFVGDFD